MNQLLKELQKLKSDPKPEGNNTPRSGGANPTSV